jgi:hypothetical protein
MLRRWAINVGRTLDVHFVLICLLSYPSFALGLELFFLLTFPSEFVIVGLMLLLYPLEKLDTDRRIFHRPDAWEAFIMRLIVLVVIGVLVAAAFWALGIPHWVLETRRSTGMA